MMENGDVCDDDIDGDGSSNTRLKLYEAALCSTTPGTMLTSSL